MKGQRDEHPEAKIALSQILQRGLIPGNDPLVVTACRGEDVFIDPTLPRFARAA